MGVTMLVSLFFLLLLKSSYCIYENCDYFQTLLPNRKYHIFTPGFPSPYPLGLSCRWFARTAYRTKIHLKCYKFYIPASINCWMSKFGVSRHGRIDLDDVEFYCGQGILDITSETNEINIVLLARGSPQGWVLCDIEATTSIFQLPRPQKCTCGLRNRLRIVGGTETGINEYPFMVAIVKLSLRRLYCGGTIISEKFVLTASHCLTGEEPQNTAVLVGDHDIILGNDTDSARLYRVEKFFMHPEYDHIKVHNDIALLQIEVSIVFSKKVNVACLPFNEATLNFEGQYLTALGWGATSFSGPSSNVLLGVNLQVKNIDECRRTYNEIYSNGEITDKQFCTHMPNKDACQSDSGGPLLWTDPVSQVLKVVGVISFGEGCATKFPGVNTKVTSFLPWIQFITKEEFCII